MLTVELKESQYIQWRTIRRVLHRFHQVARTTWYTSGKLRMKVYLVNGMGHRCPSKGPAFQFWFPNGQLGRDEYKLNGYYYRNSSEGPIYKCWDINVEFVLEKYLST